jgi:hypothetical protein
MNSFHDPTQPPSQSLLNPVERVPEFLGVAANEPGLLDPLMGFLVRLIERTPVLRDWYFQHRDIRPSDLDLIGNNRSKVGDTQEPLPAATTSATTTVLPGTGADYNDLL